MEDIAKKVAAYEARVAEAPALLQGGKKFFIKPKGYKEHVESKAKEVKVLPTQQKNAIRITGDGDMREKYHQVLKEYGRSESGEWPVSRTLDVMMKFAPQGALLWKPSTATAVFRHINKSGKIIPHAFQPTKEISDGPVIAWHNYTR